jgi:hypothetical protein
MKHVRSGAVEALFVALLSLQAQASSCYSYYSKQCAWSGWSSCTAHVTCSPQCSPQSCSVYPVCTADTFIYPFQNAPCGVNGVDTLMSVPNCTFPAVYTDPCTGQQVSTTCGPVGDPYQTPSLETGSGCQGGC